MEIIQGRTSKGSLTECTYVVDDNNNKFCFSYGSKVAAIIDGKYEEYSGDMYYSRTSNKHKKQFKKYFNIS